MQHHTRHQYKNHGADKTDKVDRIEILNQINSLISSGDLTKEEVIHFVNTLDSENGPMVPTSISASAAHITHHTTHIASDTTDKNSLMTKILYVVGGIMTLSGVLVLLSNNWDSIGFIGQWCVTVGLGLALYINACTTARKNELSILSQVLFTVSSVLLLWGSYVWYDHTFNTSAYTYYAGLNLANETTLIGFILFAIFTSALYLFRKPVLHVISSAFFTMTYYALVTKLIESYNQSHSYSSFIADITIYSMMIIGAGYIAYGYWLRDLKRIYNIYSFFGFITVLAAALFLGGIWELLYAFLAIGSIILSVRLKNSSGLVLTSVAIGIYCIKISVKYFIGNLGFSFVLLCSGLLIIALGYLTFYLNKKYITQQ